MKHHDSKGRAVSAALPDPGTYDVDPTRSSIRFTTRHMFGLGAVTGSFPLNSARITIADPPTNSTVAAVASAAGFTTGTALRDNKVHSKTFLDVKSFPEISFLSTTVRQTDAGWVLAGTLTARDGKAPVEFMVTSFKHLGNSLTLSAVGRVDRYAHGISAMKGMAARFLDIEIIAVATRRTTDTAAQH